MARSLLVHAAMVVAALSLRVPSSGDEGRGLPAAERTEDLRRVPSSGDVGHGLPAAETEDETEDMDNVPPISDYARVWASRYESELHLQDPMPPTIQLVLGVFTVAPEVEYRAVVRKTWLNQAGVCYWQREPKEGCSVYVAFVIGSSGMGEGRHARNMTDHEVKLTHREKGMLVLDTEENMNGRKSPVWFDTAARLFPWATHVGKTDMDTYPFLHKLVHRMHIGRVCSRRKSHYEILGRTRKTAGMPWFNHTCGGEECKQFVSGGDFTGPYAGPGQQWRYLAGELYIFSMPLVQQVNWTSPMGYSEDMKSSAYVAKAAQDKGFCVVLRRLDAWFHRTLAVSAQFANDLEG